MTADGTGRQPHRVRPRLLPQLGTELVIATVIAILLVAVGWASSDAIRFVYGGY
jgi:hypothetical protein